MALGRWATVIGLSMTPALVAGQSAAFAAGIAFGLDPRVMVPVVAVSGFVEGLVVAWLGGQARRIGFIERFMERMRKPRAMEMAAKWGVWGGMILGVAAFGQEPILVALRALGIGMRRLILPLAVSNALFAVVYYAILRLGVDKFLETIKL